MALGTPWSGHRFTVGFSPEAFLCKPELFLFPAVDPQQANSKSIDCISLQIHNIVQIAAVRDSASAFDTTPPYLH